MEVDQEKVMLRNNPVFVISASIIVATLVFVLSFLMYYAIDTRKTVSQIQSNAIKDQRALQDSEKQNLNDSLIDKARESVSADVNAHDDEVEFSSAELTDAALGL